MKNFQNRFIGLILVFLLSVYHIHSQTGPGGVGTSTNNAFWIKADAGTSSTTNGTPISSWNDQSGNGNDMLQSTATQQPSFATNVINGYPAVQFDNVSNTNDKMIGPDANNLDNTSGYTFFMVTRPQNADGAARVVVSKRVSVGVDQSFMQFFYSGNTFYTDIQTNDNRYHTTASFAANNNYLITQKFEGTLAAASRCKTYVAGSLDITATETNSLVPNNTSSIVIGSTDATDGRPFGGYIAEVIIYRTALSDAERIIVDNYLSAKYNITYSASIDYYAGDQSAKGDYDRDVAGIGNDGTESNPTFSASCTAGMGITAISGLESGDYLLTGHAFPSNSQITTDIAGISGTNPARWNRIWYIDVTNSGSVLQADIEFDMINGGVGAINPSTAGNYKLIYRAGTSGSWTEVATSSSISGQKIIFSSYNFNNNADDGYYTIATNNYSVSPLPIELVDFSGSKIKHDVILKWVTASETNNHFFTLYKSIDGSKFDEIGKVNSKALNGNSSSTLYYEYADTIPVTGINYYKLTQTDLNGQNHSSPIISVLNDEARNINFVIYPNPNHGEFNIDFSGIENNHELTIELFDLSGKQAFKCSYQTKNLTSNSIKIVPDLPIPSGEYFVNISLEGILYQIKIVIE